MAKLIYEKINKDTMRFIRVTKKVSYDYNQRKAKFPQGKIAKKERPCEVSC